MSSYSKLMAALASSEWQNISITTEWVSVGTVDARYYDRVVSSGSDASKLEEVRPGCYSGEVELFVVQAKMPYLVKGWARGALVKHRSIVGKFYAFSGATYRVSYGSGVGDLVRYIEAYPLSSNKEELLKHKDEVLLKASEMLSRCESDCKEKEHAYEEKLEALSSKLGCSKEVLENAYGEVFDLSSLQSSYEWSRSTANTAVEAHKVALDTYKQLEN